MRRLDESEDGAIAIIVAVVVVALIGVASLVVDVGFLQLERRKLQNAADASALALAQACARGEAACGSQSAATTYAQTSFAAPNARADTADVICVRDGNVPVPTGSAWAEAHTMSCPWLSSRSIRTFVRSQSDGGSVVRHAIAPLVGADDATSVGATARVAWGSPSRATTIPLVLCSTAYDVFTTNGTVFPSPPQTVFYSISGVPPPPQVCPGYSGAFGWLSTSTSCYPSTSTGAVLGSTGANFPGGTGCSSTQMRAILEEMVTTGRTVLIPIFDSFTGSGASGTYNLVGYGAIRLLAYKLGPPNTNNFGGSIPGCAASDTNLRCLRVVFDRFIPTDQYLTEADLGGGDFGATVILLTQ